MFVCSSLCVRPWNDVLLVSVMKGQNVSGVRKDKGKKDVLAEQISVILLRTELLQHQRRFVYVNSFTLLCVDSCLTVLFLSAGTESCVDIYESSRQTTLHSEYMHRFLCFSFQQSAFCAIVMSVHDLKT